MQKLILTTMIVLLAAIPALAGGLVNADPHSRIAIEGYDLVAFHTVGRATKGDPGIGAEHAGHTYLFASEANRRMFLAAPDKYTPAYGGYCAYGVSLGYLFPVDISTWEIVDGRLVLQFSPEVKRAFDKDPDGNFRKAEENWPTLVEKHG
jgi:YHS domain-containing protein